METTQCFRTGFNLLIAILLLSLILSCDNRDKITQSVPVNTISDAGKIANLKASHVKGIPYPEGSMAWVQKDGSSKIKLPKGLFFTVEEENTLRGDLLISEISEISVKCSCSEGTGCSPALVKGQYYCVMNSGCTVCHMATTKMGSSVKIKITGIIDYNLGLSIVADENTLLTSTEDKIISRNATEYFMNKPEVKKALIDFYQLQTNGVIPDFIYSGAPAPENYVYIKANLFGNLVMLPVLKNSIINGMGIDQMEFNTITCQCSAGSGCKKSSLLGAVYCEAGSCTVCALND